MKFKKSVCLFMSALMLSTSITPVFAQSINDNSNKLGANKMLLSLEKENELLEIAKEGNLSNEEINQLVKLYEENMISPRGKLGVILKIVKVSKNVMLKASKAFGVKMAEKTVADWTDYLLGWQDDLQDGIENFLIDKCGWNREAASWTAKTIMFIVF